MKKKIGAPPGTLTYTGVTKNITPEITLIQYNEKELEKHTGENFSDILEKSSDQKVTWVNINALENVQLIKNVGKHYSIHDLILEDVVNTQHQPKTEEIDSCLFITLKMLSWNKEAISIQQEHISFVLGEHFLVSFQEKPGDVFNAIRERIDTAKGKIRKEGVDYLLYALIDIIVDHYYAISGELNQAIASLEENLLQSPQSNKAKAIIRYKKELILIRRAIYPLAEALRHLKKGESNLIHENTLRYFSDVIDHIEMVSNNLEMNREILTGLMDLHQTTVSNDMNSVMKTLTIMASIFIPLTFIAGIYGMNFENMPELKWQFGYPTVISIMVLITAIMLLYMKRKRWV